MSQFGWKQRLLFFPPLIIGIALLLLAPSMKAEPPKTTNTSGKKVVRVLSVVPRKIQPSATGYGHSQPATEWEAASQVEGAIVWVSPQLKAGAIINQGEKLLQLDPSQYELSVARLQAELDVSRLKDKTIQASVSIAEKEFDLQSSEYQRSVRLNKTGHLSRNELDNANRSLLNSQQQLQTLKNNLLINQAEQQVLITQLALAQRDLANTSIVAPFNLRVTEKMADLAEYVNKGEVLLKADSTHAVEVSAQFPLGKMRPLRRTEDKSAVDNKLHSTLEAVVELDAGGKLIRWDASVDRSGGLIDAQTQSQSIVVKIDNPYQQAQPGQKPPLIRDTFVKVTLKAPVLKKQILLPVNAIHNNKVYTVSSEGKLVIKPVKIDFVQGQIAVVSSGVEAKDKVVLSKLSPAVEGMSLKPQPDKKIVRWLDKETGFTQVKKPEKEGK
ncbi:efflux RND transporter periplasmic adaptor subunit [Vibrio sp. SCSIO 43137]|uniref:efflux RND transporter periplasmic adaptor subunit n=1 Tax=Vibrio sp. SCSIO 43137 TaxID=3021011 RepID=UPI0023077720|nr:HlyD family efflux transporter periplasmic adaptor subunit [Vibrio sp. SCSIO 43137]WCE31674.1 MFP transporter [Vibrio sp. SCSIO 43137]